MSPQRKAIAFWLAVGAAGFLAIPWYALQDSILSGAWLRNYSAKENAPALLQGLRHGRIWLLAIGAMLVLAALAMFFFEVSQRPRIQKAPLLPPAAFPKPVASAALPFVSFQDPRASVVNGNPYPYGTALVEPPTITFQPASAGR